MRNIDELCAISFSAFPSLLIVWAYARELLMTYVGEKCDSKIKLVDKMIDRLSRSLASNEHIGAAATGAAHSVSSHGRSGWS